MSLSYPFDMREENIKLSVSVKLQNFVCEKNHW